MSKEKKIYALITAAIALLEDEETRDVESAAYLLHLAEDVVMDNPGGTP